MEILCLEAMAKLRQCYDDLKERYVVSDVTVSVQNVASQLGYRSIDSLSLEDMVIEVCNISCPQPDALHGHHHHDGGRKSKRVRRGWVPP